MLNTSDINNFAKNISDKIVKSFQDYINLEEYCAIELKQEFSYLSGLQIADELDKIIEKVKFYINKRIEYCKNQGITPEYEFNNYPPNTLIRYSVKHKESQLFSFLRKQRDLLLTVINEMSWQSFEYFCKHLLKINRVNPIELTEVNKEGIDFCGLYAIKECIYSIIIPKDFKIRIVGQIKHYSYKIQPKLIRAFKTYCDNVKEEDKNVMKGLPKWFTENKTPVLGIFMTTSDFTKSAIEYAKKEWIILKKGEQIIEFLIESPDIGNWIKNEDGNLIFNKVSFLKSFEKSNI